jgi:hypothetical protein
MPQIIFLDIDGPMIPVRASFLHSQSFIHSVFDPCAAGMVSALLRDDADTRLVISSTRRRRGKDHIITLLDSNNIPANKLHSDWSTTHQYHLTRSEEIRDWLQRHPEVTSYIAIDDETLDDDIVRVKCCTYEGFSFLNYLQCKIVLNIGNEAENQSLVDWLTRDDKYKTRLGPPDEYSETTNKKD